MANLVKRALKEATQPEQINLPKIEAKVEVDGSIVRFVVDMDEIARLSVEREGEREKNGTVIKYMKDPGVMLSAIVKGVEVVMENPEDGMDYLVAVDFALGSNFGAYGHITKSKVLGRVQDGKGLVPMSEVPVTA